MRIEVYINGELLNSIPIDVQAGSFDYAGYEARRQAIQRQVDEVKLEVQKILRGRDYTIAVVAPSLMNRTFWYRMPVFEDVIGYLHDGGLLETPKEK